MAKLDDSSKWMTVGKLICKLVDAVNSGKLKENSVVVKCNDESGNFLPILEDVQFAYDLSSDIEECKHYIEHLKSTPAKEKYCKAKKLQLKLMAKMNKNRCCWLN